MENSNEDTLIESADTMSEGDWEDFWAQHQGPGEVETLTLRVAELEKKLEEATRVSEQATKLWQEAVAENNKLKMACAAGLRGSCMVSAALSDCL